MKLTDKTILGMVSESPGRNESEPRGSLERHNPKAEPFTLGRRQHDRRKLTDAQVTSAGWQGQHGGKDMLSNWRSRPRPAGKSAEQGSSYNRPNRESERRRDGGGEARSSEEAG
jgi:hypothetical protein